MAEEEKKPPEEEKAKKPKAPGLLAKLGQMEKSTILSIGLFGAMLMNAILLGIVSVKPSRIVEKFNATVTHPDAVLPPLPRDVPNPERHIDILLGMADSYRRLGKYEKAAEIYEIANRAFDSSVHAKKGQHRSFEEANALFEKGNFRKARSLYYSFLCGADILPAEEQSLAAQAQFRIAECYLRETLKPAEEGL